MDKKNAAAECSIMAAHPEEKIEHYWAQFAQ
jgi:hypothetical protein